MSTISSCSQVSVLVLLLSIHSLQVIQLFSTRKTVTAIYNFYLSIINCYFCHTPVPKAVCPTMSSSPDHYLNPPNESYAFSSDDEGGPYNQYTPGRDPRIHNKSSSKRNSKLNRMPGGSRYNNAHNSSTVSLSDFERNYLPRSPHSAKKGPANQLRSSLERDHVNDCKSSNGILGCLVACRIWLESTSRWRIALAGCVLGLLCAVVYQGGLQLGALKRGELINYKYCIVFYGFLQFHTIIQS